MEEYGSEGLEDLIMARRDTFFKVIKSAWLSCVSLETICLIVSITLHITCREEIVRNFIKSSCPSSDAHNLLPNMSHLLESLTDIKGVIGNGVPE